MNAKKNMDELEKSIEKLFGPRFPTVGDRLDYLLEYFGLSKKEFCEKVGIDQAHFYRMTKGRTDPGFETLRKIGKEYPELSLTWLVTGKGPIMNIEEEISTIISSAGMSCPEYRNNLHRVMRSLEQEAKELHMLKRTLGSFDGSTQELTERLCGKLLELQHLRRNILLKRGSEDHEEEYLDGLNVRIGRLTFLKSNDVKNLFEELFEDGDEVWKKWWSSLIESGGIP